MKTRIIALTLLVLCVISGVLNVVQLYDNNKLINTLNDSNAELSDYRTQVMNLEEDLSTAEWDKEGYRLQLITCQDSKSTQAWTTMNDTEEAEYRALYNLEIRKHMTDGSAIIGEVPKGAIVKVVNSFFSDDWEIAYDGIKGWVKTTVSEGDVWNQTKSNTMERVK